MQQQKWERKNKDPTDIWYTYRYRYIYIYRYIYGHRGTIMWTLGVQMVVNSKCSSNQQSHWEMLQHGSCIFYWIQKIASI